jgi:hypothetical protein
LRLWVIYFDFNNCYTYLYYICKNFLIYNRQANPFNYYIDAGMQNRKIPDTWTKLSLKVSKIIVNSKFSWDTIQDDIALIKLEVDF